MAPFSSPITLLADRDSNPDASCRSTLQIYQTWTIALGSCLVLVLLGSAFFIVHFLNLFRQASAKYTALKQQHDFVASQASYYASRIERLQTGLDRANKGTAAARQQTPRESADPADMRMDPFAVGEDSDCDSDSVSETSDRASVVLSTARAQALLAPAARPRKTSVFTDGSSPRSLLLLTPGSSYVSSSGGGGGKSYTPAATAPCRPITPETAAGVEMHDFVTPIRESGRPSRRGRTASGTAAPARSGGALRVANPDVVAVGPSPLRESFDRIAETATADGETRLENEPVERQEGDTEDGDEDPTFGTFSGVHSTSPGLVETSSTASADGDARGGTVASPRGKYQASVEDAPRFSLD